MSEGKENGALARTIGLFALVVYGVGDMVGAGIYGTIGVAAGKMGNAVWLAFTVSMIAALLTGLSYASLASRYPRAAGAAYVTQRAYGWRFLSYVVGLAVVCSGLTSMAAGSRVFAATLQPLVGSPPVWILFLGFLAVLTAVNFRGIRECVWVNMVCTAIEVGGLLFVIAVSIPFVGSVNYLETPPASGGLALPLVMSGAVLTFYAFVGFEDLLNLAEEVKDPERTMPWGIILAVLCATIIYVAVSIVAISVVPYARLADPANGAALAQITKVAAPWMPHQIYTGITLFAVANTALMNFIMGSRLVYGMARQGLLPGVLGAVHAKRRTPHRAILALAVIVAVLAFSGDISELASATSLLLLLVFGLMNAALVVLKLRKGEARGRFEVPLVVPVLGFLICAALVVSRLGNAAAGTRAPLIALVLIAGISVLYFVLRPAPQNFAPAEE
ncbi:MAG TPA: APC family permease [Terrimicrobiaceae bacterium]|nr:APC family permease [Terrimicrobiaceae bacterium]